MSSRHPLRVTTLAAAAVAALLAGCGGGGDDTTASAPAPAPASQSGSSISISNFKFVPATLTVRHGATVRVTNGDSTAHTVTADDGHSFDSGTVQPDGSKTLTVSRAGRFPYHCSIHSFMKGTLVVKP